MTNREIQVQQGMLEVMKNNCKGRATCKECEFFHQSRAYLGGCVGRLAVAMIIEEQDKNAKSGWIGGIEDVLARYKTEAEVNLFNAAVNAVSFDVELPNGVAADIGYILANCIGEIRKKLHEAKEEKK